MAVRRSRVAGHHKRIQFGWASGVTLTNPDGDMAKLQDDIDRIAANGGQWVRWGIDSGEVTSGGGVGTVTWYTPGLTMNDQAIAYARSKGVNVCLIMTYPPHASGYSFANFKSTAEAYWTFLANRWAGQIGLWHIFNESNGSHYQTFAGMPFSTTTANNFPAGYLSELATLIGSARSIIKAAAPGALVSTSLEGYPMSDDISAEWGYYLDVVSPVLDVISLHIYPDDYAPEIAAMGTRAAAVRNIYGKPVFVTEFGLPTIGWTEAQQSTYVTQMVASLKSGQVKAMMLYTLRDLSSTPTGGIDAFGIIKNNGTPKAGYATIMAAMGGPTAAPATSSVSAARASVTAGANDATFRSSSRVLPGVASTTGAAPATTVVTSGAGTVGAGRASATGAANNPTVAVTALAAPGGSTGAANNATVATTTSAAALRAVSSAAAFPSTSFTVPVPAGTATGDLLTAVHVMDEGGSLAVMTATGWTLANSYAVTGWGFLKVWTQVVSGTPPATYTFGGNAGGGAQVAILGFSGAAATLGVAPVFNDVATATTSHVILAAAAASGGIQVGSVFSNWKGTGTAMSWTVGTSGMTEQVDRNDAYSSLWVGTQVGPTAGSKTVTASRSLDYVSISYAVAAA